eukprot:IDg6553t1
MGGSRSSTTTLLLLQAMAQRAERKQSERVHLTGDERRWRNRKISRVALQYPSMSAFATLFGSGCDQSLITTCGLDHLSFSYIAFTLRTRVSQVHPILCGWANRSVESHQSAGPSQVYDCLSLPWISTRIDEEQRE